MIKQKDFFIKQLIAWTKYSNEGEKSMAFSTIYRSIYRSFEFFQSTQVCYSEEAKHILSEITDEKVDLLKCNWRTTVRLKSTGKNANLRNFLVFEHYTTGLEFKKELQFYYVNDKLNEKNVNQLLSKKKIAWISKDEDKELNRLGYKQVRPDPDKAYYEAGINIIECSSVGKLIS